MNQVMAFNPVRVIKTEAEHDAVLAEIEQLMRLDPAPDTPEGERLELLSVLSQDYEQRHYPMAALGGYDAVDAIEFRMDQMGLKPVDLTPYIGTRQRVWEILHRKRPLTLRMIRNLHDGLDIPLESLIRESVPDSSNE